MARRLADWGNLPKELATKIAEHIDWYEDSESFGWVCSGWRSATKEAQLRTCVVHSKSSPLSSRDKYRLPWILLPERNEKSFRRRFYSLSKGMVRQINLPNPLSDETYKKLGGIKLLSSHGWLFMVTYNDNNNPYLLDPLLGTTIELPRISYQLRLGGDEILYFVNKTAENIKKCVLSANPSTTSDFTVFLSAANLLAFRGCEQFIVFWRHGDNESTTTVADDFARNPCHDIAYYQGHFYGVLRNGEIVKFGTTEARHIQEVDTSVKGLCDLYYLVESAGKLLIIQRMKRSASNFAPNFKEFEFDFEIKEVKQVQSLGKRSIFIGLNSSFSLDVTLGPGFKTNCIYYSEDRWQYNRGGINYWGYNLKDGKMEIYYVGSMTKGDYELSLLTWVES